MKWTLIELRRGGDKVMLQIFAAKRGKLPEVRGTIMTDEEEIEERVRWKKALERMNSDSD